MTSNAPARALVVDDDIVSLIVIRHMLESLGLDVTQCPDVASARAVLAHQRFHVVVTDYLMPDETGLALLDESDAPIVLLSGVVDRDDSDDPRMGAVSAHLTKPVSSEDLRAVVSGLVPSLVDH